MKTLIGLGCSHTQGCAFYKGFNPLDEMGIKTQVVPKLEFITDEVKKKYNGEYTTHEWVTENLTWIGKLNKHLKYDKLLNFGMGGIGIEANIRTIRNYIFKVGDLSNHLIIHQLPHFDRSEFIIKLQNFKSFEDEKTDIESFEKIGVSTMMNFVSGDYFKLEEDYIKQVMLKSYDTNFNAFKFIWEIYQLQDLIESKGGEYRCFSLDFNWDGKTSKPNDINKSINEVDKFRNIIEGDYLTYHPKETNFPHIKEVIDRINWLPLNGGIELKNQRLTDIDLVKGDGHFTEEGNENIANYLFNGIKKYEKTLKENS